MTGQETSHQLIPKIAFFLRSTATVRKAGDLSAGSPDKETRPSPTSSSSAQSTRPANDARRRQAVSTAPETAPLAHGAGFLTAAQTGLSIDSASWRASSTMPL